MGIHFETDVFAAVTVVDAKAPYITLRAQPKPPCYAAGYFT